MSVKVENRPENRFAILTAFNRVRANLLKVLAEDTVFLASSSHQHIFESICDGLIRCRAALITFNNCDVFRNDDYPHRAAQQIEAVSQMNRVKASIEMLIILTAHASATKYTQIFKDIEAFLDGLKSLRFNDSERHAKGRAVVKQEFEAAVKRDFYKPRAVDHSQTDPKVLEQNDPFDISGLIYNKGSKSAK